MSDPAELGHESSVLLDCELTPAQREAEEQDDREFQERQMRFIAEGRVKSISSPWASLARRFGYLKYVPSPESELVASRRARARAPRRRSTASSRTRARCPGRSTDDPHPPRRRRLSAGAAR